MKVFTQSEIDVRNQYINDLEFEITSNPYDEDYDGDAKFYITFLAPDGCIDDSGEITYHFQNDFPEGMYEFMDGQFEYDGDLSKSEMRELLDKIFNL